MALGAILGGATGLALIALFFLGQQIAGLPFVPFDLFDALGRLLPGGLLTIFIDTLVMLIRGLNLGETSSVAKQIEQSIAVASALVAGSLFGAAVQWTASRSRRPARQVGALGGAFLFLLVLGIEFARGFDGSTLAEVWMALLLGGWGVLLGGWIDAAEAVPAGHARDVDYPGRRALLAKVAGGSLALALASLGLGRLIQEGAFQDDTRGSPSAAPAPVKLPQATLEPVPARQLAPAPGTRPEVTPTERFYRIDINLRPVTVDGDSWRLETAGLFGRPRELSLPDLMAYPAVTQPVTLSCISNPVGGDLIGTGYWTGVRLGELLEDLGLRPEARALQIVAYDGFFESVSLQDISDPRTLLVYGMNGETLTPEHGYPLRIYIPNRYGMKQPKWITRIEAIDTEGNGYWVVRGWSREARPQIVSVVDTVAADQAENGRIPVGGIAWAGDRGISRVELQVDQGPWEEATLLTPTLGPLTWVLWRYEWPKTPGGHTFRVRATDGTGQLQTSERNGPHPDGATGYHQVTRHF